MFKWGHDRIIEILTETGLLEGDKCGELLIDTGWGWNVPVDPQHGLKKKSNRLYGFLNDKGIEFIMHFTRLYEEELYFHTQRTHSSFTQQNKL
jgi:hypothetical protein